MQALLHSSKVKLIVKLTPDVNGGFSLAAVLKSIAEPSPLVPQSYCLGQDLSIMLDELEKTLERI